MMLWVILIAVFLVIIGIGVIVLLTKKRKKIKEEDHYVLALKFLADGKKKDALKSLRKAVFVDTDNVDAYIRLGEIYREFGDVERATAIHQSLTARPVLSREDEIRIYQNLVEDYLADGRLEKAVAVMRELVKIAPTETNIKKLLGMFITRDRVEDALSFIEKNEKLIKDKKLLSGYYAEIGDRIREREPKKAEELYKKALKSWAENPHVLLSFAKFYEEKEEMKNAFLYIKKFVSEPSEYVIENIDYVEKVFFEAHKYQEISRVYRGLLEKFGENTYLLLKLVKFYIKRGEVSKAKELIEEKYMENPRDPLLLSGMLRVELRDAPQVLKILDELELTLLKESYVCKTCKVQLNKLFWFCPHCGDYMSVRLE